MQSVKRLCLENACRDEIWCGLIIEGFYLSVVNLYDPVNCDPVNQFLETNNFRAI